MVYFNRIQELLRNQLFADITHTSTIIMAQSCKLIK